MNVMGYRSDTSILHAMDVTPKAEDVDVSPWLIDPFEFSGEIVIFQARSRPGRINLVRIIFGPLCDLPLILGVITKIVESQHTGGGRSTLECPFPPGRVWEEQLFVEKS